MGMPNRIGTCLAGEPSGEDKRWRGRTSIPEGRCDQTRLRHCKIGEPIAARGQSRGESLQGRHEECLAAVFGGFDPKRTLGLMELVLDVGQAAQQPILVIGDVKTSRATDMWSQKARSVQFFKRAPEGAVHTLKIITEAPIYICRTAFTARRLLPDQTSQAPEGKTFGVGEVAQPRAG